jgi:hypothetical protein
MFAAAVFLRNWREQRPSEHGNLELCDGGRWDSLLHVFVDPFLRFNFYSVVRDCCWVAF